MGKGYVTLTQWRGAESKTRREKEHDSCVEQSQEHAASIAVVMFAC